MCSVPLFIDASRPLFPLRGLWRGKVSVEGMLVWNMGLWSGKSRRLWQSPGGRVTIPRWGRADFFCCSSFVSPWIHSISYSIRSLRWLYSCNTTCSPPPPPESAIQYRHLTLKILARLAESCHCATIRPTRLRRVLSPVDWLRSELYGSMRSSPNDLLHLQPRLALAPLV